MPPLPTLKIPSPILQPSFDDASRHRRSKLAFPGDVAGPWVPSPWAGLDKQGTTSDRLSLDPIQRSLPLSPSSTSCANSVSHPVGASSTLRGDPTNRSTPSTSRSSSDSQAQAGGQSGSDGVDDGHPPSSVSSTCASQQSCRGRCSVLDCESFCNPSDHSAETCSTACLSTKECSGDNCCQYAECAESAAQRDHECDCGQRFCVDEFSNLFDYDPQNPMPCLWLDTDQPCEISASTKDDLRRHVFREHIEPQTQQMCGWDDCHQTVDSQQLAAHFLDYHQPESYICLSQGCGSQFSDAEQLAQHMEVMHGPSLNCHWGGCEVARLDPAELTSHVNNEHINLTSEISSDPSRSLSFSTLSQNDPLSSSNLAKSNPQGSERSASSVPTTSQNLHTINQKVTLGNPHTCKWILDCSTGALCEADFGHENDLRTHVQNHHTKGMKSSFVCKWHLCKRHGKPLQNKKALDNHMRMHAECKFGSNSEDFVSHPTIVNTLMCKYCSKQFDDKTKLANHERSHTKEKPYHCEDCGNTFSSKESLSMIYVCSP